VKKKKEKEKFIDDGRTVADMNVEGFKWYVPEKVKAEQKKIHDLQITKKERRAMIKAALTTVLPVVLLYILGFFLVFVLIIIWLR